MAATKPITFTINHGDRRIHFRITCTVHRKIEMMSFTVVQLKISKNRKDSSRTRALQVPMNWAVDDQGGLDFYVVVVDCF